MYEEQIDFKKAAIERLKESMATRTSGQGQAGPGRGPGGAHSQFGNDAPNRELAKKHKEINKDKEALQKTQTELKEELEKVQRGRYESSLQFLRQRLPGLFDDIEDETGVSPFLTQYCLYPRLMFSPADAVFSIKFLKILVDLRVPKLNILNIFAQILKGIIPTIHCCTNNESENLGVFFMEWFNMIDRWTQENGSIWEKECANYLGFSR